MLLPQGKAIFSVNPEKPDESEIYLSEDPVMFSAAFAGSGEILLGTQENLLICRSGKRFSLITKGIVEGFDYSRITCNSQNGISSGFIIGTDGNGLFRLHLSGDSGILTRFGGFPDLEPFR